MRRASHPDRVLVPARPSPHSLARCRFELLLKGAVLGVFLAPLAAAQEPVKARRVELASEFETTTTRSTLVDGEERAFGGAPGSGRGAPQPSGPSVSTVRQRVVFDDFEGPESPRRYVTVEADETRTGRDGSPQTSHVEGALAGKAVVRGIDDQGQAVLVEIDGDTRQEPAGELALGVPGRVELDVLVPPADAEAGAELVVEPALRTALRTLFHPVAAERRFGGGPNGRGRGSRGRSGSSGLADWIGLLESEAMTAKAVAKFIGHEEREGRRFARVGFELTASGAGSPARLGLNPMTTGGRGPSAPMPGDADAEATLTLRGEALVDPASRRVVNIVLKGELAWSSSSKREVERDSGKSTFESKHAVQGTLKLAASLRDAVR